MTLLLAGASTSMTSRINGMTTHIGCKDKSSFDVPVIFSCLVQQTKYQVGKMRISLVAVEA